jgi:hypothetical protein
MPEAQVNGKKMNIIGAYVRRQVQTHAKAVLKNEIQPQLNLINEAVADCVNIGANSAVRQLTLRMKALVSRRETLEQATTTSELRI